MNPQAIERTVHSKRGNFLLRTVFNKSYKSVSSHEKIGH